MAVILFLAAYGSTGLLEPPWRVRNLKWFEFGTLMIEENTRGSILEKFPRELHLIRMLFIHNFDARCMWVLCFPSLLLTTHTSSWRRGSWFPCHRQLDWHRLPSLLIPTLQAVATCAVATLACIGPQSIADMGNRWENIIPHIGV